MLPLLDSIGMYTCAHMVWSRMGQSDIAWTKLVRQQNVAGGKEKQHTAGAAAAGPTLTGHSTKL